MTGHLPLIMFDFDGVLSKNPHWQWPLDEADFTPITEAHDRGYAVAILTCNTLSLVAQELKRHGFKALADEDLAYVRWHDPEVVLVTQRKLSAKIYVDDKGFNWHYGQDTGLIWGELTRRELVKTSQASQFSGDGYVTCSQGHRHWGRYGAAGLLVFSRGEDGQIRYLLQKRSPGVQMGGTWSTPGGALNYGEHPVAGALREANEEFSTAIRQQLNLGPEFDHIATLSDSHGGWAYYTVIIESDQQFVTGPGAEHARWESDGTGWFTAEEMKQLPLHPGFEVTFPRVETAVRDYLR